MEECDTDPLVMTQRTSDDIINMVQTRHDIKIDDAIIPIDDSSNGKMHSHDVIMCDVLSQFSSTLHHTSVGEIIDLCDSSIDDDYSGSKILNPMMLLVLLLVWNRLQII